MGNLVNYVTKLHQTTKRAYIDRMIDDKVNCMKKAKEYEFDYWDGNRRYGYGGYKYMPGRWKPVAELLIKNYNLTNNSQVLDVGCGKAFLLYEMKLLLPDLKISGFDISKHGLNSAQELEQDENRTQNEIEHFKKYAAAFDKVHTEKPTNKNWVKMQT